MLFLAYEGVDKKGVVMKRLLQICVLSAFLCTALEPGGMSPRAQEKLNKAIAEYNNARYHFEQVCQRYRSPFRHIPVNEQLHTLTNAANDVCRSAYQLVRVYREIGLSTPDNHTCIEILTQPVREALVSDYQA